FSCLPGGGCQVRMLLKICPRNGTWHKGPQIGIIHKIRKRAKVSRCRQTQTVVIGTVPETVRRKAVSGNAVRLMFSPNGRAEPVFHESEPSVCVACRKSHALGRRASGFYQNCAPNTAA